MKRKQGWHVTQLHQLWEGCLVGYEVMLIIRIPVQSPLGAWPDFETQPRDEVPGDLWVEQE